MNVFCGEKILFAKKIHDIVQDIRLTRADKLKYSMGGVGGEVLVPLQVCDVETVLIGTEYLGIKTFDKNVTTIAAGVDGCQSTNQYGRHGRCKYYVKHEFPRSWNLGPFVHCYSINDPTLFHPTALSIETPYNAVKIRLASMPCVSQAIQCIKKAKKANLPVVIACSDDPMIPENGLLIISFYKYNLQPEIKTCL